MGGADDAGKFGVIRKIVPRAFGFEIGGRRRSSRRRRRRRHYFPRRLVFRGNPLKLQVLMQTLGTKPQFRFTLKDERKNDDALAAVIITIICAIIFTVVILLGFKFVILPYKRKKIANLLKTDNQFLLQEMKHSEIWDADKLDDILRDKYPINRDLIKIDAAIEIDEFKEKVAKGTPHPCDRFYVQLLFTKLLNVSIENRNPAKDYYEQIYDYENNMHFLGIVPAERTMVDFLSFLIMAKVNFVVWLETVPDKLKHVQYDSVIPRNRMEMYAYEPDFSVQCCAANSVLNGMEKLIMLVNYKKAQKKQVTVFLLKLDVRDRKAKNSYAGAIYRRGQAIHGAIKEIRKRAKNHKSLSICFLGDRKRTKEESLLFVAYISAQMAESCGRMALLPAIRYTKSFYPGSFLDYEHLVTAIYVSSLFLKDVQNSAYKNKKAKISIEEPDDEIKSDLVIACENLVERVTLEPYGDLKSKLKSVKSIEQ
uniref:Uncharacterized protein n=1 Tax=Romanomermis culicivorax TaxID=13658 RepID=A0A915KHI7_ROMCU